MRFAVHRPGIPEASPRSHGVPRRDVDGRVHVRVAGETAGSAPEARLTLTRVPVHLPARRAPLARERMSDLLHPSGRLVLQPAHQQPPPRTQDPPVQPGLLPDVAAGITPGAFRGPGHVTDLQVLHPDQVEPARDVRAGLLRPVLAPVGLPGLQAGDRVPDPAAAVRAPPSAGKRALQPPQPPPLPRGKGRAVQQVAGGKGRGDCYPPVDAHGVAVTGCGNRPGDHSEGDVPAADPVHRHPVGLRAWRHRAGPAEPDPSGLGHPDLARPAGHAADIPLPTAPPRSGIPHPARPCATTAARPGCPGPRTPSSPGRSRAGPAAGPSGSRRRATGARRGLR